MIFGLKRQVIDVVYLLVLNFYMVLNNCILSWQSHSHGRCFFLFYIFFQLNFIGKSKNVNGLPLGKLLTQKKEAII
jgi:hypothetical protein